jgi:hypothetical protein
MKFSARLSLKREPALTARRIGSCDRFTANSRHSRALGVRMAIDARSLGDVRSHCHVGVIPDRGPVASGRAAAY